MIYDRPLFAARSRAGRQPYAVAPANRRLMTLAGLWRLGARQRASRIRSFTIVTNALNALCAELHNVCQSSLKPDVSLYGSPRCRSSGRC
jgi:putative SOS response-associated peptidase YedK